MRQVVAAARRRVDVVRLHAGSGPARLLVAVGGHPGSTSEQLAALTGLDPEALRAAARVLLEHRLVEDSRFGRPDVWSRTDRGRTAARRLEA